MLGARGVSIYGAPGYEIGTGVISIGDINNDGIDDVLIGTPFARDQIGAAFVVYGQSAGSADIHLSALNHKLGFSITGHLLGGLFGFSGSGVGDFNGDGIGDFAISAPFANSGAGVVYILFGIAGYRENMDLRTMPKSLGFTITGHIPSGNTGYSIAGLGDISGDGVPDLLVSVPYADETRGRTYVLYGSITGEYDDIDLAALNNSRGILLRGSAVGSKSGFKIAHVGDLNGDGVTDFAIGEPFAGKFSVGAVKIVFGCRSMCYDSETLLNIENFGINIVGNGAYSRLGMTISKAGDVNRDGIDDVIMSSFVASNLRGEVYVVYGSHGLTDIDLSALQKSQGVILRGSGGGYFGMSATGFADINHDGVPDIVVTNSGTNGRVGYGVISNPALSSSSLKNIDDMSDRDRVSLILDHLNGGEYACHVGDFNNDGFVDFAVVTSSAIYNGTKVSGLHVVYDMFADASEDHFTHSPVSAPTLRPTYVPTSKPTWRPTNRPTMQPTAPTWYPTRFPTRSPNSTPDPSVMPTSAPTLRPSFAPTVKPSTSPTMRPSSVPTHIPSFYPTSTPTTSQPSNVPSHEPSFAPNITPRPTSLPTLFPTSAPTSHPTPHPTSVPTCTPTSSPTVAPSVSPSGIPSVMPTLLPSKIPTSVPSSVPTPSPSAHPTNKAGYSVIIVTECGEYSGSNGDDEIIVDTPPNCPVTLTGGSGKDVYIVKSIPKALLTISDFNILTDRINLKEIRGVKSFSDVNMTRGSVIIHLPNSQKIVLLNCDPDEMSKQHFVFAARHHEEDTLMGAAFIVFIIVMVCSTTCFLYKAGTELDVWESLGDIWEEKKQKVAPDIEKFEEERGHMTGVFPSAMSDSERHEPDTIDPINIPSAIVENNRDIFPIDELVDISSSSLDELDDAASDYYNIDSSDDSSHESESSEKSELSSPSSNSSIDRAFS